MRCIVCKERPVVSIAVGKCEVCLYAEEKGKEAAERQLRVKERRQ